MILTPESRVTSFPSNFGNASSKKLLPHKFHYRWQVGEHVEKQAT
jgi:hypothetical protein